MNLDRLRDASGITLPPLAHSFIVYPILALIPFPILLAILVLVPIQDLFLNPLEQGNRQLNERPLLDLVLSSDTARLLQLHLSP